MLRCRIVVWRIFLCGVGCNSAVILSGSPAVEASWDASDFSGSRVAPLRLWGRRGKQSTPSVGWEVPVSLQGSASGSAGQGKERGMRRRARDIFRSRQEATVWNLHSVRVNCLVIILGYYDALYVWCCLTYCGSFRILRLLVWDCVNASLFLQYGLCKVLLMRWTE